MIVYFIAISFFYSLRNSQIGKNKGYSVKHKVFKALSENPRR